MCVCLCVCACVHTLCPLQQYLPLNSIPQINFYWEVWRHPHHFPCEIKRKHRHILSVKLSWRMGSKFAATRAYSLNFWWITNHISQAHPLPHVSLFQKLYTERSKRNSFFQNKEEIKLNQEINFPCPQSHLLLGRGVRTQKNKSQGGFLISTF